MLAFVTVGSTKFDKLIQAIFSEEVLSSLKERGYTHLIVQCGNSAFDMADKIVGGREESLEIVGVHIEFWQYKPSLEKCYEKADLVISHAGSGTIVDVLRMGKVMIVVPNNTLADNHQEELASALQEMQYLKSTGVENLAQTIREFDPTAFEPFPPFEPSRFARVIDEAFGFV
ncbi:glycosyltransferase 28 [Panaeolus papilionaceus]|nr:glycosyltransferase 28 [Panaeolus papilionaceus]